jgi:hypothetical protein
MLLLLFPVCNTLLIATFRQYYFKIEILKVFLKMETIMDKISKREKTKESFSSLGYMPRVFDVRAPCQWLEHCYDGKCPAFTKLNGNFYCARPNQNHS